MGSNLGGLALVLGVAAVGISGYALVQQGSGPADLEARLAALEAQVDHMDRALLEATEATGTRRSVPSLLGHALVADHDASGSLAGEAPSRTSAPVRARMDGGTLEEAIDLPAGGEGSSPQAIQDLVDKAVDRKAAQIQTMQDKKPTLDVFAKTLELSDEQRQSTEREVLRAQRDIYEILAVPAADGTDFLDELVDIMADGIANPGQQKERGLALFGRLMSETIPGTEETYAARAERVKGRVRDTFKREWRPAQYATFEAWKMDPTELKNIEGSPWKDLESRIIQRARDLGADLPENFGK